MMLLRHTTAEEKPREALTINPSKTCQPVGAMYAALGIHGCLPHSHGSQGCCSYHRTVLTRHYKEPVMAGTSSFTEGSSVFGGQMNLIAAINNLFTLYNPDLIAVHTTCLSETIGDDLPQIISKADEEGKIPRGKLVLHTNTPSYIGTHVTGYSNMCASAVTQLAEPSEFREEKYNIISGWVEPSDMREIKRLLKLMKIPFTLLPDTSDVLDAPQTGHHEFYPRGGTPVPAIRGMGKAAHTFCLGAWGAGAAGEALLKHCKVPFENLDLPLGIRATDRFLSRLTEITGFTVPDSITDERGRLVDMITDNQQYLYGKRVALWGDPDQLIPLAEFLSDIDMKPVYIVSGTAGKPFAERLGKILGGIVPEAKFMNGERADLFRLHQWIKQEGVDLLMGNTHGKYIARDENTPLVRMGFPITDRVGHSYFPTLGYAGGMRIVEKILGAFMDKQDRESPETRFELVM